MAGRVQMMHCGIWNWPALRMRPIPARLLYHFLRANYRTGVSGLYVAPPDVLATEARFTDEEFQDALVSLQAEPGLVRYCWDTGALWVVHKLEQELDLSASGTMSDKTAKAVQREIFDSPAFRDDFVERYGQRVRDATAGCKDGAVVLRPDKVAAAPPSAKSSPGPARASMADVDQVLRRFNRPGLPEVKLESEAHRRRVRRLLAREGVTVALVCGVVESRHAEWVSGPQADEKTRRWFKPSTVFGDKFDEYAERARYERMVPVLSDLSQDDWLQISDRILAQARPSERWLLRGTAITDRIEDPAGPLRLVVDFPDPDALKTFRASHWTGGALDELATEVVGVPTHVETRLGETA